MSNFGRCHGRKLPSHAERWIDVESSASRAATAVHKQRTIHYLSLCTGKRAECWSQPCGIIKISARITHGSVVVIFPTGFCLQKEEHRCRSVVSGGGGNYCLGLHGFIYVRVGGIFVLNHPC
jgi:hypothetical protein